MTNNKIVTLHAEKALHVITPWIWKKLHFTTLLNAQNLTETLKRFLTHGRTVRRLSLTPSGVTSSFYSSVKKFNFYK